MAMREAPIPQNAGEMKSLRIVTLPLTSVVFATSMVTRLGALSCIFHSCELTLARSQSAAARKFVNGQNPEPGQHRFASCVSYTALFDFRRLLVFPPFYSLQRDCAARVSELTKKSEKLWLIYSRPLIALKMLLLQ